MPELDVEKLCQAVVIKNVPKYSHVYVHFYSQGYKAIADKRIEEESSEKRGEIAIPIPFLFEGRVNVRLWRPSDPLPGQPYVRWDHRGEPNFITFNVHTDEITSQFFVISEHRFANLKMVKTSFTDDGEVKLEPYPKKSIIGRICDRCKEVVFPEKLKPSKRMRKQRSKEMGRY